MDQIPKKPPSPFDQQRSGRALAVIVSVRPREKGFIFARDVATDEEYFVHVSVVPPDLWPLLDVGTPITCNVTDSPRGAKGWAIRQATDAEQIAKAAEVEESRGNR